MTSDRGLPLGHPQRWNLGVVTRWWLHWHRGVDGPVEIRPENWDDESRTAAVTVLTAAEVALLTDPDGVATMVARPGVDGLLLASAAVYLLATEFGRVAPADLEAVVVSLTSPSDGTSVPGLQNAKATAEVVSLAVRLFLLLKAPAEAENATLHSALNGGVTALTTPCPAHTVAAVYCLALFNDQHPGRMAELRELFGATA